MKKAIYDNCAVGMARAIGDGMSYLLVDVVVNSKYQKKGIGKKLINSIIDEIKGNTIAGEYSTINLISIKGMEKVADVCRSSVRYFGIRLRSLGVSSSSAYCYTVNENITIT